MTRLALIDYGSGNVRSVRRALEAAAAHAGVELSVILTAEPDAVIAADRIVLPGVGHFADCAQGLRARPGLVAALEEAVRVHARPFLGICVGMQLMAEVGREDVEVPGLGWIQGAVERLRPTDAALPVPHMGWNALGGPMRHPVLAGLGRAPEVYFTHSYAITGARPDEIAATCDYGGAFPAAVAKATMFGTQFHPEKSQAAGLSILAGFLGWRP
jgi:imidazole glycerol-phosphate synthase subunit HisH